ncbi:hypothetical protein AB0H28_26965 [Micromonospora sp. NPDC050980]|uniref:DUF6919 domain-containing protein n=1 Tax=Micromonospora sp. NPDC050980 TaxID=3155161 RepID=UPI0033E97FA0
MGLHERITTWSGFGPLTRADRRRWAAARTLDDLAELTAQWLEGRIASQPGYYGRCDVDEDEAPGLTDTLTRLNRAGYLTDNSQAGYDGPGYDGRQWRQLAAVTGFGAQRTRDWLTASLAGTRYRILAWPCGTSACRHPGSGVPVTTVDDRPFTVFGAQLDRGTIAGELYDGCDDAAIDAVCAAWQITVYDPQPGANDLWPLLRDATDRTGQER